uniref:Uncharacterized protein n=1 Tax=Salarias fasciatus TaxID=181472 RepID=A0A672G421_SALFA
DSAVLRSPPVDSAVLRSPPVDSPVSSGRLTGAAGVGSSSCSTGSGTFEWSRSVNHAVREPMRRSPHVTAVTTAPLIGCFLLQAQGRLEDQRSRAPGPMDDEDFFLLLLRVQGGRMDEQRTAFPSGLQT